MTPTQLNEIKKCKSDFLYFCKQYLKIVNKDNKVVSLRLNKAQMAIYSALGVNRYLKVLKARQLGSSTFIAAYYFWRTLFNLNERTLVIAHQHESVKAIFRIYQGFYNNLPSFMKFKTIHSSANTIEFDTGSFIMIGSASSEAFRGTSAISNLHLSEVAFWDDLKTTISSVFQATGANPHIILETTANSINDFYNFYEDDNGYEPVFLSWDSDENNVLSKLSDSTSKLITAKPAILDYLGNKGYSDDQIRWAVETFFTKTAGDISRFKQEYASDPLTCFIVSGDKFFSETYIIKEEVIEGYIEYKPPLPGRIYSIGVDSAGGSNSGDYSTFVVLDITSKEYPQIVATYMQREPLLSFSHRVLEECRKYSAYAVIEKNSYGLTVLEHIVQQGYTFLYTKEIFDKVENRFKSEFGFFTSAATRPLLLAKIQRLVNERKIFINDIRIQNEINSFIYKNGKAQAATGKHDDLVLALALSLMALEQYEYVKSNVDKPDPKTANEWMRLEVSLGIPKEALLKQGIVSSNSGHYNRSALPAF
jgi:hypothetical protein